MKVGVVARQLTLGDTVRFNDGLVTVDWKLAGYDQSGSVQSNFWFTTDDLDPDFAQMRIRDEAKLAQWLDQDTTSLFVEASR